VLCCATLCREREWDIDVVVPVPDGSRPAAIQVSNGQQGYLSLGALFHVASVAHRRRGDFSLSPCFMWSMMSGVLIAVWPFDAAA
jgi:hypothetical protein